jgi:hypothetical protein
MSNNGYKESAYNSNTWLNGGSTIKKDGESTIINHKRHNTYGSGMSNSDFNNRIK